MVFRMPSLKVARKHPVPLPGGCGSHWWWWVAGCGCRGFPFFPWVCWINEHPGILTKRHPFWQNRFLKILMFGDGFIGWGDPKIQLNLKRWVERISDRTCLENWGSNPPMKSQRMEETYARLCHPERNWSVTPISHFGSVCMVYLPTKKSMKHHLYIQGSVNIPGPRDPTMDNATMREYFQSLKNWISRLTSTHTMGYLVTDGWKKSRSTTTSEWTKNIDTHQ